MNFIKRIRIWLQKPWFVGLLSVIAILFSFRNIVVPLMDLSSANQQNTLSAGGVATGKTGLLLPGGQGSAAEMAVDRVALRKDFFANREYRRNPFLVATDPRQPGYQPRAADVAEVKVENAGAPPDAEWGSLSPRQLFVLNAILAREGQQYVLINRQVADIGDALRPNDSGIDVAKLSGIEQRQLQDLLAAEYFLARIGKQEVEISSPDGDFTVSLQY